MLRLRFKIWPLLGLALWAGAPCRGAAETVRAVWLGQDEHDFCQTARVAGSNDIQDLHLRLEGLAEEEIEGLLLRRDGGGEWAFGKAGGPWTWKAHVVRPGGSTADVFMEPSHRDAAFRVDGELIYAGGKTARFSINCGRSSPNLFMPGANLSAVWAGQERHDWTGRDAAVGPDGCEDVRLDLAGISTRLEVKSVVVEGAGGVLCEYGLNPRRHANAELVRDGKDKSRAQLFFSPARELNGQKLTVRITYMIERSNTCEIVAGPSDPNRALPPPAEVRFVERELRVEWLGHDGAGPNRGDIHVRVDGLPPERALDAAALSDKTGGYWIYRRDDKVSFYPRAGSDGVPSMPMVVRRGERAARADLFLAPYRDERDTPMLLRIVLDDGVASVHRFTGQACDPFQRGALPAASSVEARPGDDLNALAEKYGTIRLGRGRYEMSRPWTLARPVTVSGPRDAVLMFTQTPAEAPWRGAILIGAGNVTLEGFSVRFTGNFRWALHGPGGAGIIRTFDPPGARAARANIVLSNLDVETSSVTPSADPKQAVEAPCLTRFAEAASGKIIGNRFRGGTVDVNDGPWEIRDNDHRGTVPGTVAWDAFGGHWLHDFTLERNRVHADGPSGKIWRFISMNQLGQRVVIRSNEVSGVGMRDDDKLPNPNAPEILLTESYRLYYEGKPSAISADGQVVQIPLVMQGVVRPGSLVSILTGEHAGKYAAIAQPLAPTAFLLADPLPRGDYAISVAHGFVDDLIEGNRIDVRGGKSAVVVLAGNHWGLRLLNNHLLGGGDSMLLQSTPTEDPNIWGWSHTPFMGFVATGNVCEDSLRGVSIDVYSNRHNKTSTGRTYLSGLFRGNIVRGIHQQPSEGTKIGAHSDKQDGEMRVRTGNR